MSAKLLGSGFSHLEWSPKVGNDNQLLVVKLHVDDDPHQSLFPKIIRIVLIVSSRAVTFERNLIFSSLRNLSCYLSI